MSELAKLLLHNAEARREYIISFMSKSLSKSYPYRYYTITEPDIPGNMYQVTFNGEHIGFKSRFYECADLIDRSIFIKNLNNELKLPETTYSSVISHGKYLVAISLTLIANVYPYAITSGIF